MTTEFPVRARRDDDERGTTPGHMIVQQMVEFLRDEFDRFVETVRRGQSTVTNGNTTVLVTHGLDMATYSAVLTPLNNPGGAWWISGKTPSQFTINLAVAAPVAGITFDWILKGESA